jgi:hypothetical protein
MAITLDGTAGITTPPVTVTNVVGVGGATPAASGAGITFPATQSASTNANTLDDYREGTVNPGIAFGGATTGITYDTTGTGGFYTRIGQFVHVVGTVVLTNKGSATGAATITGLPFTSASSVYNNSTAAMKVDNVTYTGMFENVVTNNATTILLQQVSTAGSRTSLDNTNFSNSSVIVFSLCYIAA